MTRRYYLNNLPHDGGLVSLPDEEAAHAIRVMRVQAGQSVVLFDGLGNEANAVIESVDRRQCVCRSQPIVAIDRMPRTKLNLAVALPKPDRAKEMIERLTELGVERMTPLIAERTQRPPTPSLLAKLARAVTEACKQCGRNRLMRMDEPITTGDFFASATPTVRWISHQGGQPIERVFVPTEQPEVSQIVAAIGPEGGWTDSEVSLAEGNGFGRIDLGPRILRVETAAVAIAVYNSTV